MVVAAVVAAVVVLAVAVVVVLEVAAMVVEMVLFMPTKLSQGDAETVNLIMILTKHLNLTRTLTPSSIPASTLKNRSNPNPNPNPNLDPNYNQSLRGRHDYSFNPGRDCHTIRWSNYDMR